MSVAWMGPCHHQKGGFLVLTTDSRAPLPEPIKHHCLLQDEPSPIRILPNAAPDSQSFILGNAEVAIDADYLPT
jgi:hypothetical protein